MVTGARFSEIMEERITSTHLDLINIRFIWDTPAADQTFRPEAIISVKDPYTERVTFYRGPQWCNTQSDPDETYSTLKYHVYFT